MRADISKMVSNPRNYGGEKELISAIIIVCRDGKELREVIDCRFYMGRSSSASTVYCSLWIRGRGKYGAGHGSAGGWGYYKQSAALQDALDNVGIVLYGDTYKITPSDKSAKNATSIGGAGGLAMENALIAVCRALGYRGKPLIIHV